ncbi:glycosyl transferase [Desulfolithobacter dissulfuricans]|uniref:Glycosyl transferase n=1 Tax=Desulfolithobacter dissulfuricans TaxID=2795293 RepID=A0A915U1K6_9BACT|nr:glycosyltransferase family 4 protein [Desulfolithobacter dissulfuricans]BCO09738.1 glycosyl transferase [Desulfolithobacter dissulfuricans]
MKVLLACGIAAGLSWLLTAVLRRYALSHSLLDVPNQRSSHTVPTPRGGGLAIVVSFLALTCFLVLTANLSIPVLLGLAGAGAWVALVGFLDDRGHIPARWRLLAHFAGAAWALAWLGGLPSIPVPGCRLDLGWSGNVLAAVYLVWLLNLYNFMDGIDGIAGIEAITVCLGAAMLAWLTGAGLLAWLLPLLLASAVLGFLCWNFPVARIFMGDAGSGFLGVTLGVLSIQAAWEVPRLFWAWLILLGVFIVDATLTLLRRMVRGEKLYQAHRSHGYQHAARKYGSHRVVSLTVGAINVCWLYPLAMLVALRWLDGVVGLVVAYAPLVWLAFRFRAGEE